MSEREEGKEHPLVSLLNSLEAPGEVKEGYLENWEKMFEEGKYWKDLESDSILRKSVQEMILRYLNMAAGSDEDLVCDGKFIKNIATRLGFNEAELDRKNGEDAQVAKDTVVSYYPYDEK